MTNRHAYRLFLLLACLPWIAACANPADSSRTTISQELAQASTEIRDELATGNMSLSSDDNSAPDAEITPQGDLLIDGRKVETDTTQRGLLIDYRAQLAGIAQAGADIGLQGADLAMKAMGEAAKGIFNGATEQDIERSIQSQAGKIEQEALKLCERMPALLAAQQKLAASLPEFRPYASVTAKDVEECRQDVASRR